MSNFNYYQRVLRDSAMLADEKLTVLDVMRLHTSEAFQKLEEAMMQRDGDEHDNTQS